MAALTAKKLEDAQHHEFLIKISKSDPALGIDLGDTLNCGAIIGKLTVTSIESMTQDDDYVYVVHLTKVETETTE